MASKDSDKGSDKPADDKRKKKDETTKSKPKKFLPGVPKIFSSKSTKDEKGDKKKESAVTQSPKANNIPFETIEGNKESELLLEVHNQGKPNPLLKPRSIHSLQTAAQSSLINNQTKVKPQFGIIPVELAQKFPEEPVPEILIVCIEILKKDIMKEGLFRIPGRLTNMLEMKISFEQGNGLSVENPDTYSIAGLVAQFFRELPEPLLMYDLYSEWIQAVKSDNEEDIKERIQCLINKLPEANYNILKYFVQFLVMVGKHSGANRMGSRNLALVFGASLLNPPAIEQYDLENIKLQCTVIEYLIDHYSLFFEGQEESNSHSKAVKQVATIPAGAPGKASKDPNASTNNKRKGFMKKKGAFFSVAQHSSSSSAKQQLSMNSHAVSALSPTTSDNNGGSPRERQVEFEGTPPSTPKSPKSPRSDGSSTDQTPACATPTSEKRERRKKRKQKKTTSKKKSDPKKEDDSDDSDEDDIDNEIDIDT